MTDIATRISKSRPKEAPLLISPDVAEAGLNLITSALVAAVLINSAPGRIWEASCLVILAIVACVTEPLCHHQIGKLFIQREAESNGVSTGILSLSWVAMGLAGAVLRTGNDSGGFLIFSLQSFIGASAATLLCLFLEILIGQRQLHGQTPSKELLPGVHTLSRITETQDQHPYISYKDTPSPATLKRCHKACKIGCVVCIVLVAVVVFRGFSNAYSFWEGLAVLTFSIASVAVFQLIAREMPRTFTVGESIIFSQGFSLLSVFVLMISFHALKRHTNPWSSVNIFIATLLFTSITGTSILVALLVNAKNSSTKAAMNGVVDDSISQGAAAFLAMFLCLGAIKPAVYCLAFATASWTHILILVYWIALMAISLPIMHHLARAEKIPNILLRKGYHILAAALFIPPLLLSKELLGMALAVAFAALAAVEVLRLSNIPLIASKIQQFMASFTDSRDSGLLFVTHFTLLLGMAVPIWLANAVQPSTQTFWPVSFAGICIIGFGDTAASAVGRLYGKTPICAGSRKTVKGTFAGAAAALLGWGLLYTCMFGMGVQSSWNIGGDNDDSAASTATVSNNNGVNVAMWVILATVLSSVYEAVTAQLDNLVVPLHYFALLCCI